MPRTKLTIYRQLVTVLISMIPISSACWAQSPESNDMRDMSKSRIEAPVKTLLKFSTQRLLRTSSSSGTAAPGLVHWHRTFNEACERAKVSGKPVLLFHMMGSLDQEFT